VLSLTARHPARAGSTRRAPAATERRRPNSAPCKKAHSCDRHHIANAMAELVSYLSIVRICGPPTFLLLLSPAHAGLFFRRSTSCVENRWRADREIQGKSLKESSAGAV